jgi:hypothetical protein
MKFEQFTIRFGILTQKRYESQLIRPEIENQSKYYPIEPKINIWSNMEQLGAQKLEYQC